MTGSSPFFAIGLLLLGMGMLVALVLLRGLSGHGMAARRQKRLAAVIGDAPQMWRERQALSAARDEVRTGKLVPWWRRGIPRSERLERRIAAAGGQRSLSVAVAVALGVAVAGFLLLTQVFTISVLVALALAVAAAPVGGRMTLHSLAARRRRAFLEGLPDAIDLIVRSVRAGIPVTAAMTLVGQEVQEPVRGEFKRLSDAVAIGIDLKEALDRAAERISLPDFDFFVICLMIQRETGGQLAETLQNLSDILRRRKDLRRKQRALTAEGRVSAKIVAAIPFVAGFGLFVLNPAYARKLIDDPTGNRMLLAASVALGLGLLVIARMTRSPE
ncbi:type II secretion system F family protein [Azospirillum sp. B506]|uniref:type II secretion system F family protein n=1 Tax=Azospirillum sp. B506 TaxID=137721 RepID=UPI000344C0FE|nr:type II secretion system F family protein [Azospirillum sp. B506]